MRCLNWALFDIIVTMAPSVGGLMPVRVLIHLQIKLQQTGEIMLYCVKTPKASSHSYLCHIFHSTFEIKHCKHIDLNTRKVFFFHCFRVMNCIIKY